MSTYCAPCLADLALVRDAVTSVGGTAACTAHAVLLTHPGDTPQQRLTRLGELRTLAEGKLATASAEDAPAIELLVQEYALAGAMDMSVPLKELAGDRSPRPPKSRRNRSGRGERSEGERHDRGPRPPRGERPSSESASTGSATGDTPGEGLAATSDAAFTATPEPATVPASTPEPAVVATPEPSAEPAPQPSAAAESSLPSQDGPETVVSES